MRQGSSGGFTLVEVLIALALSAAIFAAALNLLLGIVGAWEKAREGDMLADEEYRLFGFLQNYLESTEEDAVAVENLPGERGEKWLIVRIEDSPFTADLAEEWRTERFALVREQDELWLVPFVGEEEEQDRPQVDDGLLIASDDFEMVYWTWDEDTEEWDEVDRLESRGGQEPEVPQYVILQFPDAPIRWFKIGSREGELALW